MKLNFIFEEYFFDDDFSENELNKNCKKIVKLISDDENIEFGTLNILFCNTKTIKRYNQKYLFRNRETDIITFEYKEKSIKSIDSDIIISSGTVKKNAKYYKTGFKEELHRVVIHGILHLCGFKDKLKPEKILMRNKENYYLKKLKLNAG